MRCALLHGFAGTPAVWDDVIAAWKLPEPPRTIALPGHGGGPVQPNWKANLEVVANAIGDCSIVIGYSLGARIALGLVAERLCSRAVLISVNPGVSDDERPARRQADAEWATLLRTAGLGAFADRWSAQPLFASQARVPLDRRAARRRQRMTLDAEPLAFSLEVMGLAEMPDYRAAFAHHRDTLALIAGADDAKYLELAQMLPASSLHAIDRCGHDPTLEQPEALAAAIARAVERIV